MPPNFRFPHVDHVLLLNLSTPRLREEFFGLKNHKIGAENLELILNKRNTKSATPR